MKTISIRQVLALLLAECVSAPLSALASCPPNTNAHWAGSNSQTFRPFHEDGPWEVQWTLAGTPMIFQVILFSKAGDGWTPNFVANQSTNESGAAFQAAGGDFYIEVNAAHAPWSICAVPVP